MTPTFCHEVDCNVRSQSTKRISDHFIFRHSLVYAITLSIVNYYYIEINFEKFVC